jgi:hypothetical protein
LHLNTLVFSNLRNTSTSQQTGSKWNKIASPGR